jgi:hypothetical protein
MSTGINGHGQSIEATAEGEYSVAFAIDTGEGQFKAFCQRVAEFLAEMRLFRN